MSLMTDEELREVMAEHGWCAYEAVFVFARAIEALAHECGRQQGLKEVLDALREYPCATYQIEGMFAAIAAVKEHAAKGAKT